jgi:tRNA modification GTPase
MKLDTIAAIATPSGSGGIGIIRISGTDAESAARRIFRRRGATGTTSVDDSWVSHHLYLGQIVDYESKRFIDEAFVVLMRAPRSYTREDVVEIQSHGGAAILTRILDQIVRQGIRLAEPGEFTRRAFLSGRIDLSQAEAVADVINARSQQALEIAALHLGGRIKTEVEAWIEQINRCLAELQAGIEFGDEVEPVDTRAGICTQVENELLVPIQAMLHNYTKAHVLRDGVRVSIAGRPNVGKSSLLNRLIRREKAIVTGFPGTTRDPIEQACVIQGVPVTLVDTAGLREGQDPIECLGVCKTHETVASSDLVLFIVDATDPMNTDDRQALDAIGERKLILVVNKTDLLDGCPTSLPPGLGDCFIALAEVSALRGVGIDLLERIIAEKCLGTGRFAGPMVIPTLRQKAAFELAMEALRRACDGLRRELSEELVVCDLSEAVVALGTITGTHVETDLLDQIFSRFCIGK